MTTENWINVAMVIMVMMTAAANLLGPVLAVYAQLRMSQPKPTPDDSQPNANKTRLIRRLADVLLKPWFWLPLVVLVISISAAMPVKRLTVFCTAFGISSLFFIISNTLLLRILSIAANHLAITSAQVELLKNLYGGDVGH